VGRLALTRNPAILTFLLGVASPALAQGTVPHDVKEFGLICFCNSRVATPHLPIGLDNNGKILFAARNGVTPGQLASAGIPATDSQLRLLTDWSLLTKTGAAYQTSFPILDPASMAALRERLASTEKRILPALDADSAAIKRELTKRGYARSAYALLFSYVLDGLVWQKLEAAGKLPKTEISVERPYWSGTFWAVYPKQDAMPGTNSRAKGRYSLRMLWNPAVVDEINAFYGAKSTGEWMDAFAAGSVEPPLYGPGGPSPLIIREDRNDPIFVHGSRIADTIAAAMLVTNVAAQLPQADESQRLLIGTHEFIWMVLADLAAKHRISQPEVLVRGAKSSADLAPLVVAIVSPDKP